MKICLMTIGATHKKWAEAGEKEYSDRLRHYVQFEKIALPDIKSTKGTDQERQKILEGEAFLQKLNPTDHVVLLDERGKELTSRDFSRSIETLMLRGFKRVVFLIGGPYGFSQDIYDRADGKISFSRMTFPHDLIRTIFMEQLYRAFSIMRNEPYHHD